MAQTIAQGDLLIIEGLLTQPSITAAADYARVSPDTIYRRLREPEFVDELDRLKGERLEYVIAQIDRAAQLAVAELTDIITKEDSTDRDRIAAARTVLAARGWMTRAAED